MFCCAALTSASHRGLLTRGLLTGLCVSLLHGLSSSLDPANAQIIGASADIKQILAPEILRAPAIAQLNSTWQTFVSEKGLFSVSMPSAPATYTFSPEASAQGSAMYMQMQLVDPGHLEIYAAAFIESSDLADAAANTNETLLSCVTGLSAQPPAAAPRAITLEGALGSYSGIEAEFQTPDGNFQVSRCYLVGDRAYMLTATRELFSAGSGLVPVEESLATPSAALPQPLPQPVLERSPTMEAFFSSFKILE